MNRNNMALYLNHNKSYSSNLYSPFLKNKRGKQNTTYLQAIQTQLKEKLIQTLEDAMIKAKYRTKWRAIVQALKLNQRIG